MGVRVGDKVRFLNEVGGGTVVKLRDKRMAIVESEDGFELPVLISDLVVVDKKLDSLSAASEQNYIPDSAPLNDNRDSDLADFISDNESDEEGDGLAIYIALVPDSVDSLTSTTFTLYLINDSAYRVFFSLSQWNSNMLEPVKTAFVPANTKLSIRKYRMDELEQRKTFNLQAVYFKNIPYRPFQPEYYDFELNPLKLIKRGAYRGNDFFETDAYLITVADTRQQDLLKQLDEETIKRIIREKERPDSTPGKQAKTDRNSEPEEIDLHIHQLVDHWQELPAGEILQIQLARFETALQGGIKAGTKQMVFIHGVGNGKLKYEIGKVLDRKYPKLRYQDASFKEYGYGATLVYIK